MMLFFLFLIHSSAIFCCCLSPHLHNAMLHCLSSLSDALTMVARCFFRSKEHQRCSVQNVCLLYPSPDSLEINPV